MTRIILCVIQLAIIYLIPTIWNLNLILRPEIVILLIITSFLILTQPNFDLKEARQNKGTDKWSFWAIMVTTTVGQIISVFEWSLSPRVESFNLIEANILIGICLMIIGLVIRIVAITSLGRNFSGTVQIKSNQEIIKTGLYKFLRHPSYTGAWMVMLGSSILLGSILGLLILGVGMIIIYVYRIKVEEKALIEFFGEKYIGYQKTTWKMFPLIW